MQRDFRKGAFQLLARGELPNHGHKPTSLVQSHQQSRCPMVSQAPPASPWDAPDLGGSKPGTSLPRAGVSLPPGGDFLQLLWSLPPLVTHPTPHTTPPRCPGPGSFPPSGRELLPLRAFSLLSEAPPQPPSPTSAEAKPLKEESVRTSLRPSHLLSVPQHQWRHTFCPKFPMMMGILPLPGPRAQPG